MSYDISQYNLDVEETAKLFHWTPWHVRKLARNGNIPGIKRIRKWFFCKEQLVKLLNGLKKETGIKTKNSERKNETRCIRECDIFS